MKIKKKLLDCVAFYIYWLLIVNIKDLSINILFAAYILIVLVVVVMSNEQINTEHNNIKINVEYCGACDYGGHCVALAQTIQSSTPRAMVSCKRGRQGSFEIVVNDKLIYSKLQTMALPDYEEVAQVVNDVSKGSEPREIKGQQPINCAIT